MPKSKNSAKAQPSTLPDEEAEKSSHPEESTRSDQESETEVTFNTIYPQAPADYPQTMYMPYVENPIWTGQ